jgi:hypothetical protein
MQANAKDGSCEDAICEMRVGESAAKRRVDHLLRQAV